MQWLEDFPFTSFENPARFAVKQKRPTSPSFFDRTPATIPITLHHPVFGKFQDDCDTHVATKEDYAFVSKFLLSMSEFYGSRVMRAEQARLDLETYGIEFRTSAINRHWTDGDLCWSGYCYGLMGLQWEIDSEAGVIDPLLQANQDYTAFMRQNVVKNPGSNLPCFIVYIAGEFQYLFTRNVLNCTTQELTLALRVLYGRINLISRCFPPCCHWSITRPMSKCV